MPEISAYSAVLSGTMIHLLKIRNTYRKTTLACAAFLAVATTVPAATSLTQFGVTWSFDRDYPTGQFANGDYWVVGPVTVTKITPNDTNLSDTTDVHGSVVNPLPVRSRPYNQGWDSRIPTATYLRSLNVARTLPLRLAAGSSLVSTVSDMAAPGDDKLYINDAAVLTVVGTPPAAGSFRPPYGGTDKTIPGNVKNLDLSFFRNFAPVKSAPSIEGYSKQFNQPMIDIIGQWVNSDVKNANAGAPYGRDIAVTAGNAVLSLNMNYTREQKLPLLIKLVQRGIDTYGLARAGMVWFPNGGHNTGRKLPMLIAGMALRHPGMLEWSDGTKHLIFQEDMQHWYVTATDVSTSRTETYMQPFTKAMIGTAEWGSNPISERAQTGSEWQKRYRHVNGAANTGLVLAAELMGLRKHWNWEPLFDYTNKRFWPIEGLNPTYAVTISPFHRDMWVAYRAQALSSPLTGSTPPPVVTPPPVTPPPPVTDPSDSDDNPPAGDDFNADNTTTEGMWQNIAFASKSSAFTLSFEMVGSKAPMYGVAGMSYGRSNDLTDMITAVRFGSSGYVDVLNSGSYQAKSQFKYSAGIRYKVTTKVDFAKRVYSVTIAASNGAPVVIAENYAFRSQQSGAAVMNTVAFWTQSGSMSVLNVNPAATVPVVTTPTTPTPTPTPTPTGTPAFQNGSFESGATGWSTSGNLEISQGGTTLPSHGNRAVIFNAGQKAANGTVAQTFATVAGKTYKVAFDVATRAFNKDQQALKVTAQGKVSLLSKTLTLTGAGGGRQTWTPVSYTFVADGTTATLKFADVSGTTDSIDLVLDNVRVTY